jgi:tetratricopeptide (TPR) repeat protein
VIEAHPELLAPLGSEVLREWEEQSDNRISRALLRTYRALLTRCRVIGIERAFLQWGLRSEQLAASQADCPPSNWEAATDEKAQAAARFQMDRSRSHIRRGIELASAGRHDEALAEFDLAIEAKPDNPGAHNSRGKLLKMMDRDGEAAKEYTRAIELAPGEAAFRYNRGTLYLKVGRWSRALLDLESALRVDPAWAEARVNLGSCLLNMGRDDEALEEFQTAATMEPGLVQAQWNTALVFLVRGRQDEALPWVRRSAELGVEQAINLLGALEGEHIRDARAGLY